MSDLVVVGGGLAAVRAAQTARDAGHEGRIVLLSEEAELPYDRPPLSKDVLLGTFPEQALLLLPAEGLADKGIEVLLGHRAVSLDLQARTVGTQDGTTVPYDRLVVATGCRARVLPTVAAGPDVHYLRTADDARRLAAALAPGTSVAIVGAGFIGLEVASSAQALGCDVIVIEAEPHPLTRALGPDVAAWLQAWHTGKGVVFRCGVTVDSESPGDRSARLSLSDGTTIKADVVVIGIGITRELDWLRDAGLEVHAGLVCDDDGRTSDPFVFAAGDIACRHDGDTCRPIQHWTAAAESAGRAARTAVGAEPKASVDDAYFWSHQTGLRLQAVGHDVAGAQMSVVSGDLESGAFVVHYERDGVLVAVFASNSPKPFLMSRKALRALAAAPV